MALEKKEFEVKENHSKTGKLRALLEDHPAALRFCERRIPFFREPWFFCFVFLSRNNWKSAELNEEPSRLEAKYKFNGTIGLRLLWLSTLRKTRHYLWFITYLEYLECLKCLELIKCLSDMFRFPFSVLRFSVIACAQLGLMGSCFFFTWRCPVLVLAGRWPFFLCPPLGFDVSSAERGWGVSL